MLDKYLITLADINKFRPTAELDDDRLAPYIIEAQNIDLLQVLGEPFLYDLLLKFDDSGATEYNQYQKLLEGETYTVGTDTLYFEGIKPIVCYFTLAKFIVGNPINITRFGFKVEADARVGGYDTTLVKRFSDELKSAGVTYQNKATKYLQAKATTYPLYKRKEFSDRARTGFNFFKL